MKRLILIITAVLLVFGLYYDVQIQNVFDEMYYGHSDVSMFKITSASYQNFGLQDIPHSVRYMVDDVVIEYMETDLWGAGEHLNFKWFLKEGRLDFFYLYPSPKEGVRYVVDMTYSPKDHTLRYLPLRISSNDDQPYESVDSFLASEGIDRASVEKLLSENFFNRLINRWLEVNGTRSRFTVDDIGKINIENHLWDDPAVTSGTVD